MNDVKEQAPDTNNFNEIDFYLAACTIHVFGAIMEYAIVLFLMKTFELEWTKKPNRCAYTPMKDNKINIMSAKGENAQGATDTSDTKSNMSLLNVSVALFFNLDWISLLFFPFSFAVFNIFYWSRFK